MSPSTTSPIIRLLTEMTPENAEQAIRRMLVEARTAVDALEGSSMPWAGLFKPLHDTCHPLFDAWGILSHMLSVMNSADWRRVQEALQPEIVAFSPCRLRQLFYDGFTPSAYPTRPSPASPLSNAHPHPGDPKRGAGRRGPAPRDIGTL